MIIALALLLATVATSAAPSPLTVFVGAKVYTDADGFQQPVPKEILNSVNDLRRALGKYRDLRVVPIAAGAHVAVYVTDRGWESEQTGAMAVPLFGGVVARPTYANYAMVHAEVHIGEIRRFVTGSQRTWSASAKEIAQGLGPWLIENRDLVLSKSAAQ